MKALAGARGAASIGITIAALLGALLIPPIAQPLSYHDFADCRPFFNVPNFLNVASNAPFVWAGLLGILATWRGDSTRFLDAREKLPYFVFFFGAILTCFGSMYYHLGPDNPRLVWDRLPMTLGFAGLVAAAIKERVDLEFGLRSLWPLVVLGVVSVLYWYATERAGAGNLVPYAIYQGWAILIVVLLLVAFAARRYTQGHLLWWAVGLYALAKVAETFDLAIYRAGEVASGHTIKHLLAAGAVYAVVLQLRRRAPTEASSAAFSR
jgi:hypothetical protein